MLSARGRRTALEQGPSAAVDVTDGVLGPAGAAAEADRRRGRPGGGSEDFQGRHPKIASPTGSLSSETHASQRTVAFVSRLRTSAVQRHTVVRDGGSGEHGQQKRGPTTSVKSALKSEAAAAEERAEPVDPRSAAGRRAARATRQRAIGMLPPTGVTGAGRGPLPSGSHLAQSRLQ